MAPKPPNIRQFWMLQAFFLSVPFLTDPVHTLGRSALSCISFPCFHKVLSFFEWLPTTIYCSTITLCTSRGKTSLESVTSNVSENDERLSKYSTFLFTQKPSTETQLLFEVQICFLCRVHNKEEKLIRWGFTYSESRSVNSIEEFEMSLDFRLSVMVLTWYRHMKPR